jgi:uncharacterized membrane protein/ketosteroid isomerase-like protein
VIEIIPNWHPILVHFTIALLSTAVLLFVVIAVAGRRLPAGLETVANWNLWIGVVVTGLTVLAGLQAEGSVAHDEPAHLAMENHEYWALATASLFALLAVWNALRVRRQANVGLAYVAVLLVGLFGLMGTGLRGANLVFGHGLGVRALPDLSREHSHGESGEGDGHAHEAAAPVPPPGPPPQAPLSPAEAEVVAALQSFHEALTTGDVAAVEAQVVADDSFMMIEGTHVNHGWADYRDNHLKGELGDLSKVRFRLSDYHVQIADGLAATSFAFNILPKTGPERNFGSGRETVILVKTDAGWKIRFLHSS